MGGLPDLSFAWADALEEMTPTQRAEFVETDDASSRTEPDPAWRGLWQEILIRLGKRTRPRRPAPPFYLRAVLLVPIREADADGKGSGGGSGGSGEGLGYGVWLSVGREGFMSCLELAPGQRVPVFRGELANDLPGFPGTLGMAVEVDCGENAEIRPFVRVPGDGELARAQRDGITLERAWEIVRETGILSDE